MDENAPTTFPPTSRHCAGSLPRRRGWASCGRISSWPTPPAGWRRLGTPSRVTCPGRGIGTALGPRLGCIHIGNDRVEVHPSGFPPTYLNQSSNTFWSQMKKGMGGAEGRVWTMRTVMNNLRSGLLAARGGGGVSEEGPGRGREEAGPHRLGDGPRRSWSHWSRYHRGGSPPCDYLSSYQPVIIQVQRDSDLGQA